MTLLPGHHVGPYEVLASIGAGGMGEVFRARDTRLGRDVAIKVLPQAVAPDADRMRRLEQEARTLAALSHPNVLAIHDVGTHDGSPYVVMELLLGQTLKQRLASGPLPATKALELGILVAQGLAAAHEKGIIHRDLKPANVFLTSDGGLKVLDFGLARQSATVAEELATEAPTEEMPSRPGIALGTIGYMSPEQVRGEPVDARSDVFALGALLYEMLSGRRAFCGETAADTLAAILREDPPDLDALARKTSAGVPAVLRCCLEKRREARFSSAHDVALALRALVGSSSSPLPEGSAPPERTLVVLPLQNLSPDPDNAYFADGLTEELIAQLSKVRSLRVISRTSAMRFRGTDKSVPQIARELNVRYVLEGSVRRAGSSLRVTAQLIEAATDVHLWAETYGGTLDDVFDVQERIARAIADALRVRLSPDEDRKLAARPLPNAVAYDCYLRACQEMWAPQGLQRAERHLQNALGIVGEHPLLLATLSMVRFQAVNSGLAQDETLQEARELADRALSLDASLGQAHAARGMIAALEGDLPTGVVHLRRARAEAPGDAYARTWLAYSYLMAGKSAVGARLLEEGFESDPVNPMTPMGRGLLRFFDGDFEASLDGMALALQMVPDWPLMWFWNGLALAYAGRRAAALEALAACPADVAGDIMAQMGHMLAAALSRDGASFDALLTEEALVSIRRDGQLCYHVASFGAELGRTEEALGWLERAVARGFFPAALFLADPFLAPLRKESRFEAALSRARQLQASVPDES